MSATLFDYENVEPLRVREMHPIQAAGRLIGWAGPSNRDQNVVVSHRHRHSYDGGKQDYFRLCGGYTYDDIALEVMKTLGADRIAVLEVDNDRVLEFDLTQFFNTTLTSETVESLHARDNGEVNNCVPVSEALHTWDLEECHIERATNKPLR